MKITGPGGPAAPSAARRTPGSSAEGFAPVRPGAASGASAAARPASASGVSSLGALLALQDVDGPLERRRRSVNRAGRILDGLDTLKLSLLGGADGLAAARSLQDAVRDQRAAVDDAGLEGVLDEVELRAAVELAKLERALAA